MPKQKEKKELAQHVLLENKETNKKNNKKRESIFSFPVSSC